MNCNHPQFVSFPSIEPRNNEKVVRTVCIGCGQVRLVHKSGFIEVFRDTGVVIMVDPNENTNNGKEN